MGADSQGIEWLENLAQSMQEMESHSVAPEPEEVSHESKDSP